MELTRNGKFSIIGVISVATVLIIAAILIPSLIQQQPANAAVTGDTCSETQITVTTDAGGMYIYPSGHQNVNPSPTGCSYMGSTGWYSGTCNFARSNPTNTALLHASTDVTCPPIGGGTVVNPDGTITIVEEHEAFDPLDPDPNAVRAWGGYDTTFASNLIVYVTPYGYPYYHHTGQVIGVMDFNAVGIPEAICLIGSVTGGNETEVWRVDSYYMGGDQVQANLYENDVLTQEAWFDVPGIGERAGEVPCQAAPGASGGGDGSGEGGGTAVVENPSPAGTVEVVCRQNLRQDSNTDTPVLAVINPGTALSVWGRSNDNSWLEVTTPDGIQGWAFNGRCLNAGSAQIQEAPVEVVFESQPTINGGEALTQAPAPQTAAATSAGGPVVGITCRQNMRTGPGTNFAVDRVLTPGMTANVVGRSGDAAWLQVSDGTFGGWVYRGQCVMPQQGDVTAAPVTVAFGG